MFLLPQPTIYNRTEKNVNIQTYNFSTKHIVGPTTKNSINLQPTIHVTPPPKGFLPSPIAHLLCSVSVPQTILTHPKQIFILEVSPFIF